MTQAPMVRLHLFFALENDRAVILRQGPSKQFRLILWHRDDDRFEDGQWLRHSVSPDWCDLSPDGQYFLYHALDGRWHSDGEGSYSAISRPPYFTALALFPIGDKWAGGGRFVNNGLYVAVGGRDRVGRVTELSRIYCREWSSDCPTGLRDEAGRCARVGRAAARVLEKDPPQSRTCALDRYDTQGGALYRRRGGDMQLIRDFTDMTFERMRAPYDWRDDPVEDPVTPAWHPLREEKP